MSESKLKCFDANARCGKCGHDDIGTSYHSVIRGEGGFKDGPNCHYGAPCFRECPEKSHLLRHCRRCGYEWLEACVKPAKERANA